MDGMNNRIKDLDKYVRDMGYSIELRIYDPLARSIIYDRPQILDSIIDKFSPIRELSDRRIVNFLDTHFRKQRSYNT